MLNNHVNSSKTDFLLAIINLEQWIQISAGFKLRVMLLHWKNAMLDQVDCMNVLSQYCDAWLLDVEAILLPNLSCTTLLTQLWNHYVVAFSNLYLFVTQL
jgi:hypothetical protein